MIDKSLQKLFLGLVAIVFFLLCMHVFPDDTILLIDMRFNLNEEANIPTWYSTILLFSVSITSFANYYLEQKLEDTQSGRLFWLGFGAVYCFLSIDEAARIHEFMNYLFSTKWVFLYAPFAALFLVLCVRYFFFLRKDYKTVRNWIIGGLSLYIIGVLFLEFISHIVALPPLMILVEITLEEGFEMIGTIMVLIGCLHETRFLFSQQYRPLGIEQ